MYEVFNMGHRFEIYTDKEAAKDIIAVSKSFNIEAKIIGETRESTGNKLTIHSEDGIIEY